MKPRLKRDGARGLRLPFGRARLWLLFVSLLTIVYVGVLLPVFFVRSSLNGAEPPNDAPPPRQQRMEIKPPLSLERRIAAGAAAAKSKSIKKTTLIADDDVVDDDASPFQEASTSHKKQIIQSSPNGRAGAPPQQTDNVRAAVDATKEYTVKHEEVAANDRAKTGLSRGNVDKSLLTSRTKVALAAAGQSQPDNSHSGVLKGQEVIQKRPPLPKHLQKGPVTTVFSQARKDRSGAAILYYFMGHAYAMKYGLTYGGICGNTTTLSQQLELISFLGLEKELPLACPTETLAPDDYYLLPYFLNVDQKTKVEQGILLLTPEWVKYMRERGSPLLRKETSAGDDTRQTQVAVHVRRGDVQTCHVWRFLPNQHYLEVLDRYVPSDAAHNVTIYTESKNSEGIKPFVDRNYNINTDGELMAVWGAMIQADVLVLSRSDFSLLPAIFNSGKVLFTTWADDKGPLSHWVTVDESISNRTFENMKNKCKAPPKPSPNERPGVNVQQRLQDVLALQQKNKQKGQATNPVYHNESHHVVHDDLISLRWNASEECYNWKGATREVSSPENMPKALIVTLLLGPETLITLACQTLPNQLHYFAQPQGLDWLILVDDPLQVGNLTQCLDLEDLGQPARFWKNDDGSTMETKSYRFKGNDRTTIMLAQTTILQDMNLDPNWDQSMLPMVCNRYPMSYIQGTRWYSNELLHLAVLKEYDYFLKMDLDIYFLKPWNHFSLAADMRQKRTIFGHAAHYVKGGCSCTRGIAMAVKKYQRVINQTRFCTETPSVHKNCDYYFTNFIIGQVEYWTQPKVRHFSRYLTDYPHGFTSERWTDQTFFHNAMALFVGPNFEEAVADYTDIRCMPDPTCWESARTYLLMGFNKFSPPCDGYMVHTKRISSSSFTTDSEIEAAKVLTTPYQSAYVYNASNTECAS